MYTEVSLLILMATCLLMTLIVVANRSGNHLFRKVSAKYLSLSEYMDKIGAPSEDLSLPARVQKYIRNRWYRKTVGEWLSVNWSHIKVMSPLPLSGRTAWISESDSSRRTLLEIHLLSKRSMSLLTHVALTQARVGSLPGVILEP